MFSPSDPEVRRFQRVALRRLEEAQFLLKNGYTTAAVYLGGYAVECVLKALVLSSEPVGRHPMTLASFRGVRAHDFEWLRKQLAQRKYRLPAIIAKELAKLNWWSTELRYQPGAIQRRIAETFLIAVETVVRWSEGR